MRKVIAILAAVVVGSFLLSNTASASVFTIGNTDLMDTVNFVAHDGGNGSINSRTLFGGGTCFNITLPGSSDWEYITIGDNFDHPYNDAGLNILSNLTGYDKYSLTISNPGTGYFMAALYMNTGWTDDPFNQPNNYYQSWDPSANNGAGDAWTWVTPGSSVTFYLDFSNAAHWTGSTWELASVVNRDHVTDIGFLIGSNLGSEDYQMPGGIAFEVDVAPYVPVPAAVWLLGSGLIGLVGLRRKLGR